MRRATCRRALSAMVIVACELPLSSNFLQAQGTAQTTSAPGRPAPGSAAPTEADARAQADSGTIPRIVFARGTRRPSVSITGWPAALILLAIFAGVVTFVARFFFIRRRARVVVAQSAEQYRLLFDGNPCPMYVFDVASGTILNVNDAAVTLFGYSREEFVRRPVADLLAPEGVSETLDQLATLTAHELSWGLTRMRRKDGALLYVDARERSIRLDGRPAALMLVIDETARREAERGIRDAEARVQATNELLQSLIDVAPHAIIAMDTEYRVTMWNAAATRLFGWTATEVLGRTMPHDEDEHAQDYERRLRQVARDDVIPPTEIRRRRKDGKAIDVFAAAGTLRDSHGRPTGYIGIFTDLTERKLLEGQLRQSQKMEAVGRLAGGIAHDFNNILTVIMSYVGLMTNQQRDPADRDALQEIGTAASRAAALTRQLLSFSRKQVVQPTMLDLNAVVTSMTPMVRRVVAENIQVLTSLTPMLGLISADAGQVEQVILNLVVNASDAMPDGGTLVLETANLELDADYARLHPEVVAGPYVMLAATDTGIGMDAETVSHIFEPFFTTKEEGKGTGIGLATTHAIVRQFSGHVAVYSEPGHGTTFKIYLPRQESPAQVGAPVFEPHAVSERRGTILLVEDDATVRRGVRATLARLGYAVLEASDGESALAIAGEFAGRIDVVVTDVMMPGMSGQEFATRLAASYPDLPVIFTSGYTDDEVVRRGLVEKGRVFVQKPFSSEQLTSAIDSVTAS